MRSLGCGVTVVVVICSLQLILLLSHTDPMGDALSMQNQNSRLWHYLQVHEANLTALALQQRELTRLLGQLNNLIVAQQRELRQVEDQMATPAPAPMATPLVVGAADTAVARKMKEMSREHQEEIERQQQQIQSLQQALQRLSEQQQQHPVPVPAVAAAPVEDGQPGAALALGNQDFPAEWLAHFSRADLEDSAKEAEKWRQMARNAAIHSWKGYRERAWGKDEMRPVSGSAGRVWGNLGLQILDGLSTLWIMDLKDQFNEGAEWVEQSLQFDHSGFVSFFRNHHPGPRRPSLGPRLVRQKDLPPKSPGAGREACESYQSADWFSHDPVQREDG